MSSSENEDIDELQHAVSLDYDSEAEREQRRQRKRERKRKRELRRQRAESPPPESDSFDFLTLTAEERGEQDTEEEEPTPSPPPPPPPPKKKRRAERPRSVSPPPPLLDDEAIEAMRNVQAGLAPVPPQPPPMPTEPEVTTVPVSAELDNFDTFVDREPVTDPDHCVWCLYALSREQLQHNKYFIEMVQYHQKNRHRERPFAFVQHLQDLYNKNIRCNLLDKNGRPFRGGKAPWWAGRTIWEHDFLHVVRPQGQLEAMGRAYAEMLNTITVSHLYQMEVTTDPVTKQVLSTRRTMDFKASKEYREIAKQALIVFDKVGIRQDNGLFGLT